MVIFHSYVNVYQRVCLLWIATQLGTGTQGCASQLVSGLQPTYNNYICNMVNVSTLTNWDVPPSTWAWTRKPCHVEPLRSIQENVVCLRMGIPLKWRLFGGRTDDKLLYKLLGFPLNCKPNPCLWSSRVASQIAGNILQTQKFPGISLHFPWAFGRVRRKKKK